MAAALDRRSLLAHAAVALAGGAAIAFAVPDLDARAVTAGVEPVEVPDWLPKQMRAVWIANNPDAEAAELIRDFLELPRDQQDVLYARLVSRRKEMAQGSSFGGRT